MPDGAWYHQAVIYEVHVRAFADANGDGIGDFKGLTSRLDYLRDLGVTALWLLPFYPSPLRDDGYDIADYMAINPAYGTMRDFRVFLREAHRRDLKVITELVINHTSDQHPWFQRARRAPAGSPERDFYVWSDTPDLYRDARIIFQDTETSNWTWDPVANAYYWHRFFSHQPDLNFDNPAVHEAVFDALDFWLDAGVDGLRLDAVPYLYERDGTMCENLPETHGFLKELRARVDSRYRDRMLLAEANQWPEDSVAYFGDGDECHMAFHFPLMPRLFMALRMENRFPIIDILDQTPPIPETAGWAIFLRNHDELTLEMVTDEERDYMYRVYAADPQARINVGIRRRLAPLLGNDRRQIELMNALLLSLPGTPVLYYGDEIGMGDNVYLGDRNGVRTPMQWSGHRNAGFSEANPQRLYFPVITDPEYHYESVNVEVQRNNPNSLWWWVKRALALRRSLPELARGDFEFVPGDNPKVLSYLRAGEERSVLVVVNLSRHPQPVDLELSGFAGVEPLEVFGHTRFPAIAEGPYRLTLGPHDFYWFELAAAAAPVPEGTARPRITVRGEPAAVFRARAQLERVLLADVIGRRWFRSKARKVRGAQIVDRVELPGLEASMLFLQVDYAEGDPEVYVVPVALAVGAEADWVLAHHPEAVMAEVAGAGETALIYDAVYAPGFGAALVSLAAGRRRLKGRRSTVAAGRIPGARSLAGEIDGLVARVGGAEQTNTSVVLGDRLIVKLFRKLEEGANPEVEMGRFLSSRFPHAPGTRGVVEVELDGATSTLSLVQQYVPNQGDAWTHTVGALTLAFERMSAGAEEVGRPPRRRHPLEVTPKELERGREWVGVTMLEAELLGRRTGEMHLALASERADPVFAPEPVSTLYQRALYQSVRSSLRSGLGLLRRGHSGDPALVARVLAGESEMLETLKVVTSERIDADRIRIHGDFHLGQVLYTGNDFVVIDFEGEPQRPLSTRRIKRLGLRDAAGMVRSYHYAAMTALRTMVETGVVAPERAEDLTGWAESVYGWVAASYLGGYLGEVEGTRLVPADRRHLRWLLDALLVEKAAYELEYELNNRPDWVGIPLRGLLMSV